MPRPHVRRPPSTARLAEATGRAEDDLFDANPWYEWGPYLSERAWGTVREDYSAGGDAWNSFPHDHARSRAYRWNEDGMAGISDIRHELCLALALWNGNDPILKERMFGLTGPQGNHGEDVKEYWWYLEGLPSHALLRWRYHYPQAAFPYEQLVNHGRGLHDPELELLDTGVFDGDRYWSVDVTYAKASPTEVLMRIELENHGPDEATLHVLPTLWFRNTWSWDRDASGRGSSATARALVVAGSSPRRLPARRGARPRRRRARGALLRERVERAARLRLRRRRRRTRRTASTTTSSPAPPPSTPTARHEGGASATASRSPAAARPSSGCGCTGPRRVAGRRGDWVGRRRSTRSSPRARPTPTSSTPRSRRRAPTPSGCGSCARRAPGSCGASRSTRTTCAAGSTATRASRRRRRRTATAATATGGTSTRSTCSRCRTRGSTRGSPPGTSASTASPGRTSTPRSRSTS